jgi:ATP-dependent RNA helicase DDX31/DBP7
MINSVKEKCNSSFFGDSRQSSFEFLGIPQHIINHLSNKLHIYQASLIQQLSFKHISSGCDILMKSETGSGKTLAFLLPIVLSLGLRKPKVERSEGTLGLCNF